MLAKGCRMSGIGRDRSGILTVHHNLTVNWQVSEVQIKTMVILVHKVIFVGKTLRSNNMRQGILSARRLCHFGLNYQESPEEALLGIYP